MPFRKALHNLAIGELGISNLGVQLARVGESFAWKKIREKCENQSAKTRAHTVLTVNGAGSIETAVTVQVIVLFWPDLNLVSKKVFHPMVHTDIKIIHPNDIPTKLWPKDICSVKYVQDSLQKTKNK